TAQRLDGQDDLVAGLKRLTRPPIPGHQAWRAAFQIPDGRAAVRPLDLQQKIGVRTSELELLHHAFELDRILLVKHGERWMRQNGTAGGDEGKAQHCSQLPSHAVPLFDRSITRAPQPGTLRIHAMRMSSLEPEESPGPQGCDACR